MIHLYFLKNLEPAPDCGKRFNQHVEPQGFYFVPFEHSPDLKTLSPGWIQGTITLERPLLMSLSLTESHSNWKLRLELYYKAKKKALSLKLRRLGYDSIIIKNYENEMIEAVYLGKTDI